MSRKCEWLHLKLEELPLVRYPFDLGLLPGAGIYFYEEGGEFWGRGGSLPRIVRVGTHRKDNFRQRMADHFLIGRDSVRLDRNAPKPSDRSIFRKNTGRAVLNGEQDPYLQVWDIDFIPARNRAAYGHLRELEKEAALERRITELLRSRFSFRFLVAEREPERMGLESRLIRTLSRCEACRPSTGWLGNRSPKPQIRESGLWVTQYVGAPEIDEHDMRIVEDAIRKTKEYVAGACSPSSTH